MCLVTFTSDQFAEGMPKSLIHNSCWKTLKLLNLARRDCIWLFIEFNLCVTSLRCFLYFWLQVKYTVDILNNVKFAGYSILDIGHSNVQCPMSNIPQTSRSWHIELCVLLYMRYLNCESSTVRSRYMAVIFLWIFHERHPIANPWGRDMGCQLWMQNLFEDVSF